MSIVSSPGNWSSLVAQPDPILAADGFFDAEANDAGLAAGATSIGFSVDFTYTGAGAPGAQLFNIVDFNDPNTYANPLQVGFTRLAGSATSAPEIDDSSAVGALTLLMGGLLVLRRRRVSAKATAVRHAL
jgi:MYXO-CTERM domain-containing protein